MELSLSRSLSDGGTIRVPLFVPIEVLTVICEFTSAHPTFDSDEWDYLFEDSWRIRTVQRLRLVNKTFASAASPFLIQQVFLAPNYESTARLNKIAESVFGKHVKSICIDCRLFNEEVAARPSDYVNALNTSSMFSIYSKEKLREGYRTYCELAAKQRECREKSLHVESLVNAFVKMPNLQEVVLSARHRSYSMRRTYRRLMSFRGPPGHYLENDYDHMLEPDALFFSDEDADRLAHREKYLTLMSEYMLALSQPAVSSRVQDLRLLTLDASHPISVFTGVFGGSEGLHNGLKAVFRGLRKLDLNLSRGLVPVLFTPGQNLEDEASRHWERLLKDCLAEAKDVKALSLSFPNYPREAFKHLTGIIERISFPQLRALKLSGSAFKESMLTKFITDHVSTLKNVTLRCEMTEGKWESCLASIKAFGSSKFESFALESCSENQRNLGFGHVRRPGFLHFEAPSEVVLDYLYKDGFNPAVQVTVEDLSRTLAEDGGEDQATDS